MVIVLVVVTESIGADCCANTFCDTDRTKDNIVDLIIICRIVLCLLGKNHSFRINLLPIDGK